MTKIVFPQKDEKYNFSLISFLAYKKRSISFFKHRSQANRRPSLVTNDIKRYFSYYILITISFLTSASVTRLEMLVLSFQNILVTQEGELSALDH